MEKQSDGTVKLRIVMNRQAMTAEEQTKFITDLAEILRIKPEAIKNPTFTTVASTPGISRQP